MNPKFEKLLEKVKRPSKKKVRKDAEMSWEMLEKMKSELDYFDEFLWERTRKLSCAQVPYDMVHRLNPEPVLTILEKCYERRKRKVQKIERKLIALDNKC